MQIFSAVALAFIVSLGCALLAARYLQKPITQPLELLADSVRIITELGDYSIRVKLSSKDEIGSLAGDYNSMLQTLQLRDELLADFNRNLAELVVQRSEEMLREKEREELQRIEADNGGANVPPAEGGKIPLSSLVEKHIVEVDSNSEDENLNEQLGGKVLLVDDELTSREILKALLHQAGLQAVEAGSGAEAVRMLQAEFFPFILMDIQMPEMNGYQTTNMIRAMEKNSGRKRAKVVAVTANQEKDTRQKCLEVGMDDCLFKPVDLVCLNKQIQSLVVKEQEEAKEEVSSPGLCPVTGQEPEKMVQESLWSKERALELVGGDEELFYELVTLFLDRNDMLVENIVRAVEHGDADDLLETAHAYKGAVGHFGASQLRQTALALENLARQGTVEGVADHLDRLQQNSVLLCRELLQFVSKAKSC